MPSTLGKVCVAVAVNCGTHANVNAPLDPNSVPEKLIFG
jgi:hypothetical protein